MPSKGGGIISEQGGDYFSELGDDIISESGGGLPRNLHVAHYTEMIASFEDDDLRNRVVAAITEHQHHDVVQPHDLRLAPALSTRSSNKSLDD
jgi:hypothetical protein